VDGTRCIRGIEATGKDIRFCGDGTLGEKRRGCIKAGVSDYVLKDRWKAVLAVKRSLEEKRLRKALQQR